MACQADRGRTQERTGGFVINVSAAASTPSKHMTLADLAAFVAQCQAAGVPEQAELKVTTKGLGWLSRIETVEPK